MPNTFSPDATMYCRTCSYALDGLTAHRCPECGRTFDPGQPRTYRRRPPSRRLRAAIFLSVALLGALAGYWGWSYRNAPPAGPPTVRVRFDPAVATGPPTSGTRLAPMKLPDGRTFHMAFISLEMDGRFPVRSPDNDELFALRLVDGDDDKLSVELSPPDGSLQKLTLVRDQSVEVEFNGRTFTLRYPSAEVASTKPVAHRSAKITVTHMP